MNVNKLRFGYALFAYSFLTLLAAVFLLDPTLPTDFPSSKYSIFVNVFFSTGGLSVFVLTIWMLWDILSRRELRGRIFWLLLVLVILYFGAMIYFLLQYRKGNRSRS